MDKELRCLGNVYGNFGTGYAGNVWDQNYLCPTLTALSGGGRMPMIIEKTNKPKVNRDIVTMGCLKPERKIQDNYLVYGVGGCVLRLEQGIIKIQRKLL